MNAIEPIESLLADLIAIPSVNPRGRPEPVETPLAQHVAAWSRQHGFDVSVDEVVDGRSNVVVTVPGRRGDFLLLETHLDTVETDGMTTDPYGGTVRDGLMWGRGACDAKGSLAVFMTALARCAASGQLERGVILAGVIDEEHRYRGVQAFRRRYANHLSISAAIVGEPTELRLVTAHKGCMRCRVVARGSGGHSSEPHGKTNPINSLADVVLHLQGTASRTLARIVDPLVGAATLTVTMIEGGVAPNVLPEQATLTLDRRTIPGEDPQVVWQELRDSLATAFGDGIEVEPPFVVDYSLASAEGTPFVEEMRAILRADGLDDACHGVGHGTDASKLALDGYPVVVFGPGSITQAHMPDEHVAITDLERATAVVERAIAAV